MGGGSSTPGGPGGSKARPDSKARLGWKARLGGRILHVLMLALSATWRRGTVTGEEHLHRLRRKGRPAVLVVWHDRLFCCPYFLVPPLIKRGVAVTALISRSADGDFGHALGEAIGLKIVRGSTSRGGSSALRKLMLELRRGRSVFIVADGPKGPRHEAKPGAVMLARTSGAPLVPFTWSADRTWRLGTWDGMEIPKPFSRVDAHVGEPLEVPRNVGEEGMERALARLADALADY